MTCAPFSSSWKTPPWAIPRSALGPEFSGAGYEEFGLDPEEQYVLCLRVIPMGDLNAVDIAQETHRHLLLGAGQIGLSAWSLIE